MNINYVSVRAQVIAFIFGNRFSASVYGKGWTFSLGGSCTESLSMGMFSGRKNGNPRLPNTFAIEPSLPLFFLLISCIIHSVPILLAVLVPKSTSIKKQLIQRLPASKVATFHINSEQQRQTANNNQRQSTTATTIKQIDQKQKNNIVSYIIVFALDLNVCFLHYSIHFHFVQTRARIH